MADLAGELGELLVGASQLAGGATQLEDVDHLTREHVEPVRCLAAQLPGRVVEDAQGADHDPVGGDQRARRVEAHLGDLTRDERVAGEPGVLPGVEHLHPSRLAENGRAHGVLALADTGSEADGRDLVLLPVVDDVDDGGRHVADDGGQLDQSLQVRLGRFAKDVVLRDGLTTCQVLD